MRSFALVTLTLLLGGSALAEDLPPRFVAAECPIVEQPPVIDGRLDDACWQHAPRLPGFARFNTGEVVAYQTEAAFLCDEEALYIAVRLEEPEPDRMAVKHRGRDEAVWEDDAVEIFIDPKHDHTHYVQIIVNAAGAIFDAKDGDASWNADAQAECRVGEDAWTAEMAIPFRSLGVTPEEGLVIGVNVCRDDQVRKVLSSGAPMEGGFNRVPWFGHLVLGDAVARMARRVTGKSLSQVDRPLTLGTAGGSATLVSDAVAARDLFRALAPRVDAFSRGARALPVDAFERDRIRDEVSRVVKAFREVGPFFEDEPQGTFDRVEIQEETSCKEAAPDMLALKRRLEGLTAAVDRLETEVQLSVMFGH